MFLVNRTWQLAYAHSSVFIVMRIALHIFSDENTVINVESNKKYDWKKFEYEKEVIRRTCNTLDK